MTTTAARSRYSTVAIWLHWLIALIVIANIIGGLTHDYWLDSPDPAMKATGQQIMALHKSFGLTVLLLTVLRLGWRLANPPPPLPAHMTPLETGLARTTHVVFYLLLFLLPLSGWAMASLGKSPTLFFGLGEVPRLPLDASLRGTFRESHEILGYVALATLALHVAGALKHQYFDRDNVLARMSPFGRGVQ